MANVMKPLMNWPKWHHYLYLRASFIHLVQSQSALFSTCNVRRPPSFTASPSGYRQAHFRSGAALKSRDRQLPLDPSESDSDSDEKTRKSRNEKKREARRAVRWAMDLAKFSAPQIKRILRVASAEQEVYEAVMLVKRLGPDVREGKRRQFSYIVHEESASAEASPVVVVDHHHPLFLQNSDTPGAVIIPIKLTGPENYTLWSRSMKLALRGKGKHGFIDGTCVKHHYNGELAELWEKCNAIVLSWIGCTVAAELMPTILYASHAKQVWIEFKERFDRSNLTRIYHLWTEIATLRQGRLLREVEPELMDGLIQATKDGDQTKFQALSGSELSATEDVDEEVEESEYEDDEENSEDDIVLADRWFDGLVNKDVDISKEIYSLSEVDFDRQELRGLVRKVQSIREKGSNSDEEEGKVNSDIVRAERSLTRFLRDLAKQLHS